MGDTPDNHTEVLGMSDDDFLKMPLPSGEAASDVVEDNQANAAAESVAEAASGDASLSGSTGSEVSEADTGEVSNADKAKTDDGKVSEGEAEAGSDDAKAGDAEKKAGESADPDASKAGAEGENAGPPDYEGFYKQIMTPFKANGKTISLRSPDEAIKLMQMGANYTKKVQEMVPHRKVLTMLQNHDLLDEAKLSYLIDLDKKNPDAIKKLVKDSGVDPLDINTDEVSGYKPSNHSVTDDELNFHTALEEVASTPTGKETLQVINTTWDQASKEALWKSPELLGAIQTQRENGAYAAITAEMDRQYTLGQIPPNTPFLIAYKQVGDWMVKNRSFTEPGNQASETPATAAVVATRVAAPKPAVSNGDKARAASPTKTSPNKAAEFINPLAMSDEEFLKQMNNRL